MGETLVLTTTGLNKVIIEGKVVWERKLTFGDLKPGDRFKYYSRTFVKMLDNGFNLKHGCFKYDGVAYNEMFFCGAWFNNNTVVEKV